MNIVICTIKSWNIKNAEANGGFICVTKSYI